MEFVSLPSEYRQAEWLGSTGTQWIDTGVIVPADMTSKYTVSLTAQITSIRSGSTNVLCSYTRGGSAGTWVGVNGNGKYYLSANKVLSDSDAYVKNDVRIVFGYDYTSVIVDAKFVSIYHDYRLTGVISLFATDTNKYTSLAKIFSVEIYEDDTLIRNLIPCYRISDDKPGMYDLITNTFYTNSGTGEFRMPPRLSMMAIRRRCIAFSSQRIDTTPKIAE